MHFTYSGMERPSWGFRKATTFLHLTAIYQRSLLHVLWVTSQLPLAHDDPVLNKYRKTCLPGKEKFKKLISYKKGISRQGYEAKMNGGGSHQAHAGAVE